MTVKHALTADGSPLVEAVDWNASHTVDDGSFVAAKLSATATDKVFGRSSSGAGNGEEIALTAAGRALIDDADAAAQRTTLGIATAITGTALDTLAATTDITTRNASTSAHGLLRKLDNDATHYLDGQGAWTVPAGGGGGTTIAATCQGRLTLTTAVPITTADVTAATTLYFTPFRGNLIGTYSGSAWSVNSFTEKSITLASLTSGLPYDVYIVDSTLALELLAWTNATTRATALVTQDGILCKTGALTRRYLGTICIAATGQCEDSLARRLVWNYYNRQERPLQIFDGTDTWADASTGVWRQANNTSTNHQVDYVCGVSEDLVRALVRCGIVMANSKAGTVGIGVDATTTNSAQLYAEFYSTGPTDGSAPLLATYRGWPGIGYHYLAWIEYARQSTTFIGDNGVAAMQSGLTAEVMG